MTRFLMIAMLVFVFGAAGLTQAGGAKIVDKGKDFKVDGKLTKDDPKDAQRGGPSHVHTVRMKAGKAYRIDMESNIIDSYLRLLDPKGTQIQEDDDSGGNLNAQIIFNCTKDGDYKIVATTFGANQTGAYVLTVKLNGAAPETTSAHAQMLKSDAPDFTADFAVNGKAGSLSDLHGKVVLLQFWEVRSSSSAALLPKLAEWDKVHKAKGLAIVGVTFYPSDIGQALAFDKELGEVKTVKKADRKSDQALLQAFAAHYKVGHLLLALPKQTALDVFNAYAVNGLPQVVLIDRKGVVRYIDVGGEKNAATVEAEFKKLLAEK